MANLLQREWMNFNHSIKSNFITEEGLKEGLDAYDTVIDEYDVQVSKNLWTLVIKHLNKQCTARAGHPVLFDFKGCRDHSDGF